MMEAYEKLTGKNLLPESVPQLIVEPIKLSSPEKELPQQPPKNVEKELSKTKDVFSSLFGIIKTSSTPSNQVPRPPKEATSINIHGVSSLQAESSLPTLPSENLNPANRASKPKVTSQQPKPFSPQSLSQSRFNPPPGMSQQQRSSVQQKQFSKQVTRPLKIPHQPLVSKPKLEKKRMSSDEASILEELTNILDSVK